MHTNSCLLHYDATETPLSILTALNNVLYTKNNFFTNVDFNTFYNTIYLVVISKLIVVTKDDSVTQY